MKRHAVNLTTKATFVARKQQCGAGLMEFAVAAAVLAILIFMLLQRMQFYQAQAEQAAVAQVVADVRSSLDARLAQRYLPGKAVDLAVLAGQNPFDWLDRKPANYLGEFFAPGERELEPGNWYFDRREKVLIYLLNNRKTFGDAVQKRLKFKVKLFRLPSLLAKPSGTPETSGVTFDQVTD
jgi:hypothetical protein